MPLATDHEPTIAAISTPPGIGGIAIIRMSGTIALQIAQRIFRPRNSRISFDSFPTGKTVFGEIHDSGQLLDEAVVIFFRSPHSYTCEDLIEINCHGGPVNTRLILDLTLQNGARLAGAGEFTRRAYLNGRIDLTQAEAVADLIHAKTQRAGRVAASQLQGALTRKIEVVRDELMQTLAHLEAHIDFPDEDISPDTRAKLHGTIINAQQFAQSLIRSSRNGRILREGLRTVITGEPNVGKSSLFNLLLGSDRAIITPLAGTTRDTLEEILSIDGVPLVLIDTAGIRHTEDVIEAEGIRRSQQAREAAELILEIRDAREFVQTGADVATNPDPRNLCVWNKSDLLDDQQKKLLHVNGIFVSAQTGEGIETLKKTILEKIGFQSMDAGAEEFLVNTRQRDCLMRAVKSLDHVLSSFEADQPLELITMDLRSACSVIGEIAGKTSTEDLLDRIFSSFCIGK